MDINKVWQAFPDMCSRKLLPVFLNTRHLGTLNWTAKRLILRNRGCRVHSNYPGKASHTFVEINVHYVIGGGLYVCL